jgi:hypothetical protein
MDETVKKSIEETVMKYLSIGAACLAVALAAASPALAFGGGGALKKFLICFVESWSRFSQTIGPLTRSKESCWRLTIAVATQSILHRRRVTCLKPTAIFTHHYYFLLNGRVAQNVMAA